MIGRKRNRLSVNSKGFFSRSSRQNDGRGKKHDSTAVCGVGQSFRRILPYGFDRGFPTENHRSGSRGGRTIADDIGYGMGGGRGHDAACDRDRNCPRSIQSVADTRGVCASRGADHTARYPDIHGRRAVPA